MRTIRHMSANIEGMLRNHKHRKMTGLLEDDEGNEMSDSAIRKYLAECQAKGWKVISSSDSCDGFDHFGGGCPGHEVPEVGDRVDTIKDTIPVSTGILISIADDDRYGTVRKKYGTKSWIKPYKMSELRKSKRQPLKKQEVIPGVVGLVSEDLVFVGLPQFDETKPRPTMDWNKEFAWWESNGANIGCHVFYWPPSNMHFQTNIGQINL